MRNLSDWRETELLYDVVVTWLTFPSRSRRQWQIVVQRQQIRHRYDESIFHLAAREVLSIIGLCFLRVSFAWTNDSCFLVDESVRWCWWLAMKCYELAGLPLAARRSIIFAFLTITHTTHSSSELFHNIQSILTINNNRLIRFSRDASYVIAVIPSSSAEAHYV